ncbi:MAG: methionyl aminopeptidase [Berryella intestinalis]|uniref:Methionine aminopeptidase n=1 Tax=Berryella intestinalis TaxID=1531429 RepID=A0A0A8B755_9ACTN|nr:methionyl aminopeptidase [Berryella intestinalis]AJC12633.1 methionine aminopeptidase [Berryella intestinalis]MDD7369385.1 methionyl aminopeptidase [Berryella intestinalis]MDY3128778.1 methionyl aminopeptidase [Berryella intestinalis]
MYDGIESPGRNDECWCGSGKKYKKCHRDFDEKLQRLWDEGEEVLPRSLLKTPADIEGIKRSAEVNVGALDYVEAHIEAGVTTADIDRWVHDYCIERGAVPADLNYEGFPKSVCTSINEVVCHGIPSEDEVLRDGDIVNVDMSTILGGYFSDSSRMFCIGQVDPEWRRLVEVTKRSVEAGMEAVRPWAHLGDVSAAVNKVATDAGFSVVREFGGHGCGIEFHEDPFVSFVEMAGTGPILVPGMCFTIEPMVNMGKADIDMTDPNGWTVRTADGLPSAQWEVQVVVTESGFELISW